MLKIINKDVNISHDSDKGLKLFKPIEITVITVM